MPFLSIETFPGETIHAGRFKITPFGRVVKFMLPGSRGGLIWNRPVSVLVQGDDGSENVLPMVDVTRMTQLALLGIGLTFGIMLRLITRR